MILVDSSVWIDYFNGTDSPAAERLHDLLGKEPLAVGDLILTEVLQGFRLERDYQTALRLLLSLEVYEMLGVELALKSANHYRSLRRAGITIRKPIDVMIATYCIEHGHVLLQADRDFLPLVPLGLRILP